MTEPTPFPAPEKRDALRARIEASEARNAARNLADQAREAAETAVDYTRAHPLTVIGGALAVGLALGLLSRPGRRAAGRAMHTAGDAISGAASSASASVKSVTSRRGSRLNRLIGDTAVTYILTMIDDVLDAAEEGKERAGDLGHAASRRAKKLGAEANDVAGSAADSTRALARKAQDTAAGLVRDIRRHIKV